MVCKTLALFPSFIDMSRAGATVLSGDMMGGESSESETESEEESGESS